MAGASDTRYEVFQTNFNSLVNAIIPAVTEVARRAFTNKLISLGNLNIAENLNQPEDHRASKLLIQILGKVEEKSSHFDTFVSILEDIPILEDTAVKLKEAVANHADSESKSSPYQDAEHDKGYSSTEESSHKHSSQKASPSLKFSTPNIKITPYAVSSPDPQEKSPSQVLDSEPPTPTDLDFESHDTADSSNSSFEQVRSPFTCPCCKCTLSVYLEGNCPATAEPGQFPYLDMERLDSASKVNLQAKLLTDTQEMVQKFHRLLLATKKSLNEQKVPPEDVAMTALSVSGMGPGALHKPLLEKHEDDLLRAQSISRVLLTLTPYMSFFNHEILKQIIDDLGTEKDKERLEQYLSDFRLFCKRSVFEVPPMVYAQAPDNPENRKMLAVKYLKTGEDSDTKSIPTSLAHVLSTRKRIAEVIGLDPASLFLCHIDKGCVKLTFMIPTLIFDEIFPLDEAKLVALSDLGISLVDDNLKAQLNSEGTHGHSISSNILVSTGETEQVENKDCVTNPVTEVKLRAKKTTESAAHYKKGPPVRDSGYISSPALTPNSPANTPNSPSRALTLITRSQSASSPGPFKVPQHPLQLRVTRATDFENNQFDENLKPGFSELQKGTFNQQNDILLLAFKCRQTDKAGWNTCMHPYCVQVRNQWQHYKSCLLKYDHNCERCSLFMKLTRRHTQHCSDPNCPVEMCKGSNNAPNVNSQQLTRSRSFTGHHTKLLSISEQAEEIVKRLDKEEPLLEGEISQSLPLSSLISSQPQSLPDQSSYSYQQFSKSQGVLSPIIESSVSAGPYSFGHQSYDPMSMSQPPLSIKSLTAYSSYEQNGDGMMALSTKSEATEEEEHGQSPYPTQTVLHSLDTNVLTSGKDSFYHKNRDYTINDVSQLGQGGFGSCVWACDETKEIAFAIKQNNTQDEKKIESIVAECQILSRLQSNDNVIRFLGNVMDEYQDYDELRPPKTCKMMMELAENGNLSEMLVDENGEPLPLPLDQSLFYLQQILKGVQFLHSNGVLHLDIKGPNILVFNGGRRVKLADFGTAVHINDISSVGKNLKGCTPYYAPPEVIQQAVPKFSADIWGVMCVFVEMLTAALPGCATSQRSHPNMMYLVGNYEDSQIEEIVPLSEMGLEPDIEELFRSVFRREPEIRPTALELLDHPRISTAGEYEMFFDECYEEEDQLEADMNHPQEQVETAKENYLQEQSRFSEYYKELREDSVQEHDDTKGYTPVKEDFSKFGPTMKEIRNSQDSGYSRVFQDRLSTSGWAPDRFSRDSGYSRYSEVSEGGLSPSLWQRSRISQDSGYSRVSQDRLSTSGWQSMDDTQVVRNVCLLEKGFSRQDSAICDDIPQRTRLKRMRSNSDPMLNRYMLAPLSSSDDRTSASSNVNEFDLRRASSELYVNKGPGNHTVDIGALEFERSRTAEMNTDGSVKSKSMFFSCL